MQQQRQETQSNDINNSLKTSEISSPYNINNEDMSWGYRNENLTEMTMVNGNVVSEINKPFPLEMQQQGQSNEANNSLETPEISSPYNINNEDMS